MKRLKRRRLESKFFTLIAFLLWILSLFLPALDGMLGVEVLVESILGFLFITPLFAWVTNIALFCAIVLYLFSNPLDSIEGKKSTVTTFISMIIVSSLLAVFSGLGIGGIYWYSAIFLLMIAVGMGDDIHQKALLKQTGTPTHWINVNANDETYQIATLKRSGSLLYWIGVISFFSLMATLLYQSIIFQFFSHDYDRRNLIANKNVISLSEICRKNRNPLLPMRDFNGVIAITFVDEATIKYPTLSREFIWGGGTDFYSINSYFNTAKIYKILYGGEAFYNERGFSGEIDPFLESIVEQKPSLELQFKLIERSFLFSDQVELRMIDLKNDRLLETRRWKITQQPDNKYYYQEQYKNAKTGWRLNRCNGDRDPHEFILLNLTNPRENGTADLMQRPVASEKSVLSKGSEERVKSVLSIDEQQLNISVDSSIALTAEKTTINCPRKIGYETPNLPLFNDADTLYLKIEDRYFNTDRFSDYTLYCDGDASLYLWRQKNDYWLEKRDRKSFELLWSLDLSALKKVRENSVYQIKLVREEGDQLTLLLHDKTSGNWDQLMLIIGDQLEK